MEPLCLPVVVQTRPQVGCDPDLPLPVDKGKVSLVEDGPDVIFSGWKLNVKISDVSRGICVVSDQFPVVVPKKAVEPLVLPVVVMTRSQAGCAAALTLPVDEEQVEDGPDMLSGCVMDMGDPGVERSNQVLLEVDGDGCPTRWLETEFDDSVIEKFVLVPEMSPIGSMKSAVVPTFLPALSEVCSLAVLAGGGTLLRQTPGSGRVRHSASVCPTGCWKRTSDGLRWEWRLGCGRFEGWPVVSRRKPCRLCKMSEV